MKLISNPVFTTLVHRWLIKTKLTLVHDNWIALCKSWNGFLLAKREDNYENMIQYAIQIRSIQKVLGLRLTEFYTFTPEEMMEIEMKSDLDTNESRYATTVP